MNIVNKLKWNGVGFWLCLAGSVLWSRAAAAEVTLFDQDGWTFSFDGRVNSFLSGGKGDDFPLPTPGPTPTSTHAVMGHNSQAASGVPDVGWPSAYQQDKNDKYTAVRIRSGMFGNVLGFGISRKVSDRLTVKGYVAMWSTVETLARDKWAPITAEAREGYFTATGPWGSATVGRTLGWLGRTSYEIDVAYGHGYGLGLPCTDALGPACGHIGTGALFPGYAAGISYATPSFAGLQLHYGLYDPVVFASAAADWSRAPYPRQEGALDFDGALGSVGKLHVGIEGAYQPIKRIVTVTDPNTMLTSSSNETTSIWGVSGGVRVEVGPIRLGASGFRGKGSGLGDVFQRSVASADNDSSSPGPGGLTYKFRTFTGVYGQAALVVSRWQFSGGYGIALVNQLDADKANPSLSVIHTQVGASAAIYYRVSDSLIIGLDYFRFMASWYGAPLVDANMQPTGDKLAGEKQALNFLNAGVTYRW